MSGALNLFDTINNTNNIPHVPGEADQKYTIHIYGNDEKGTPVDIFAWMPQSFYFSVHAIWESLGELLVNPSNIVGGNLGSVLQTAASATGFHLGNTLLSQLVWRYTTPITFHLPLIFDGVNDADKEVIKPVFDLLSLILPSTTDADSGSSYFDQALASVGIHAPGPALVGGKYDISLAIGRVFNFPNVVIKNVTPEFHSRVTSKGSFISADVMVEVETARVLTKEDLAKIFSMLYVTGGRNPPAIPDSPITDRVINSNSTPPDPSVAATNQNGTSEGTPNGTIVPNPILGGSGL